MQVKGNLKTFDLLVIGSGPSGGRVAKKCAEAGWKVGLAESRDFGGNCALRGCNPKKVLVRAAELVDWATRSDGRLCQSNGIRIDWKQLSAFMREFTESVPAKSREKFQSSGIQLFSESPRFIGPDRLKIGNEIVTSKKMLIAVGSRPRSLDFPGSQHVLTSDQFLELNTLGDHILFIGGGYISLEFAHVVNRAGSNVTIVERGKLPLKSFAPSLVECLVDRSRKSGIDFRFESSVNEIVKQPGGKLRVSIQSDEGHELIEVDCVVHGAGRIPNLDELDLKKGEVEFSDEQGVTVDKYLRSPTNPDIFATGDCAATGQPGLTPIANQDAFAVTRSLLGEELCQPDYGAIPSVVFTIPALAKVGLTEESAATNGLKFRMEEGDWSQSGSVRKVCETHARYKLLIDEDSDRILGAHLLGPAAAETINLFALAINHQLTTKDLKSVLFAFPTFAADVRTMV